ncbi:M56 family metallopeptidase [Polaribacter sp. IC073]|uniref:M56 family metallopeptidase n=1 Tax=Polaribacter sp. IC073 TaxID=2508540 RepID=UPI0011BEB6B8|nr:M56 family metallopeptidase [Polaribacter sp. IC073]TXD47996.1 M56 family metallopeptidase [Polaribacter sp. IC073]
MIIYILKSAGCLALLLLFYHLVLEKEKMHNFNRFYLLGSVLFSFSAQITTFTTYVKQEVIATTAIIMKPNHIDNSVLIIEENTIDFSQILIGIYCLISALFLLRFSYNLFKIIKKIRINKKVKQDHATLILVTDKILPHTFWNYIFINKAAYEDGEIEEELFTHELTHVTQKHTFDVLIIELLQAVFWINPLFIFLKKAVQLNHEFLADENVINQHKNTFQYQYLLLNKAAWNNEYYLASNLNYSLTKKRLKMMTTQSSRSIILLKKLAVIPLLTGFVFLFAERVEAQEKDEIIEVVEETKEVQKELSEKEIYATYVNRNAYVTYKNKEGKKVSKLYTELTNEERRKLVLPPPPPIKFKKVLPTKKQFEDLKDTKKYAVWVDGKVVKNEVLNEYKNSDFARYSNSFVHKNARSKRFPQKNQASLETTEYFKAQNAKRVQDFEIYKEIHEKLGEAKWQELPNGEKIKIIENPKIETIEENYSKHNGEKVNTGFKDLNGVNHYFVTVGNKTKYYNKEGKQTNEKGGAISNRKASSSNIIPGNYVTKIYFDGKIFCEFNDGKSSKKVTKIKLTFYLKENKLYESKRNQEPHFIKSLEGRQEDLSIQFSKLGIMYFKLSKLDKKKAKRPILPHAPYLKLKKNTKVFYKLRSEMTDVDTLLIPPPPPAQNASKEEVLKAKETYSDWKKITGNDVPPPTPSIVNKQEKVTVTNFEITFTKKKNRLELTCFIGCAWKELSFTTNNIKIDKFGMTNTSKSKKSDFLFDLKKEESKLILRGLKGSAWTNLSFSINENQTIKINQFGMTNN